MKIACPACGLDASIDDARADAPTFCERCGERLVRPENPVDDDAPVLEVSSELPDLSSDEDDESEKELDWDDVEGEGVRPAPVIELAGSTIEEKTDTDVIEETGDVALPDQKAETPVIEEKSDVPAVEPKADDVSVIEENVAVEVAVADSTPEPLTEEDFKTDDIADSIVATVTIPAPRPQPPSPRVELGSTLGALAEAASFASGGELEAHEEIETPPSVEPSFVVDLGRDVHETMSALEISELFARGTIGKKTRVRVPDSEEWREIAEVESLTRELDARGISLDSPASDASESDFAAETRELNAAELWKAAGVKPAGKAENWLHDAETAMVDSRRLLEQAGLDLSKLETKKARAKSASDADTKPSVEFNPKAIKKKKTKPSKAEDPPPPKRPRREIDDEEETLLYRGKRAGKVPVANADEEGPTSTVARIGIALFVTLLLVSVVLVVMASMKVFN